MRAILRLAGHHDTRPISTFKCHCGRSFKVWKTQLIGKICGRHPGGSLFHNISALLQHAPVIEPTLLARFITITTLLTGREVSSSPTGILVSDRSSY